MGYWALVGRVYVDARSADVQKESGKYTDPRFRRQVQLATFETLGRGLLVVWWRLER